MGTKAGTEAAEVRFANFNRQAVAGFACVRLRRSSYPRYAAGGTPGWYGSFRICIYCGTKTPKTEVLI